MKFFKELFRNKEKKLVLNFITMLLLGIVLIVASNTVFQKNGGEGGGEEEKIFSENREMITQERDFVSNLEQRIKNALANVEGVGDTEVVITLENEGEIVVAEDNSVDKSEISEGDEGAKRKTNNIKQENKKILLESNKPLVLKEIQPKIKGVLVVARGGGNPEVKSSVIKAIQALLNVESHKIEVLKMK